MGRHGDAGQRLEDGDHHSRRYRDRALVKRTAGLWAAHLVRWPRETLLARGAAGVAGPTEGAKVAQLEPELGVFGHALEVVNLARHFSTPKRRAHRMLPKVDNAKLAPRRVIASLARVRLSNSDASLADPPVSRLWRRWRIHLLCGRGCSSWRGDGLVHIVSLRVWRLRCSACG
jgi:hypothetical protein